jgi:hypothetical protein
MDDKCSKTIKWIAFHPMLKIFSFRRKTVKADSQALLFWGYGDKKILNGPQLPKKKKKKTKSRVQGIFQKYSPLFAPKFCITKRSFVYITLSRLLCKLTSTFIWNIEEYAEKLECGRKWEARVFIPSLFALGVTFESGCDATEPMVLSNSLALCILNSLFDNAGSWTL